ncbi:unnamed protein product [Knipowitschia caucasica]
MADIVLCEPQHLYNLLNQRGLVSRLAEINYLFLIDAREAEDYNTGHIITAKQAKTSKSVFLPFEHVEIDTMQNIVVYDGKSDSLDSPGRAQQCAKMISKSSFSTVHILKGGYEKFTALFNFFRTEQILYTIRELENLRTYPVEILPGKLYMGKETQANCRTTMEQLMIKAVVRISADHMPVWTSDVLRVEVGPEKGKDQFCFEKICDFIDVKMSSGSRVLLVSKHGCVRCSAAATAYVMLQHRCTFQEAWSHVRRCKPSVAFDKRYTEQLCEWERRVSATTTAE